jgi:hypothetical protein
MSSVDAMAMPAPEKAEMEETGLHSPPETNTKDTSDSELSDLEMDQDIGDVEPAYYADEGRVPVFKPDMAQFASFKL